jgi:AraC family transcriptional regulator of adaptative response/methylated-DNA-[protein]-cysteine methyltransferase
MTARSIVGATAGEEQAALDYQRVEKAIHFLQAHHRHQPDLAAAARAANLSEFHFQRLFTRWAGISPKRFVQFLTVEHAKRCLTASRAVLDASLDSGLSGPGRLHDLFVTVEAVTPGEFKSRGSGLLIEYEFQPTPFGRCLIGVTSRGVCWLSFLRGNAAAAVDEMREHWRGAAFARRADAVRPVANRIFAPLSAARREPLAALVRGTNFQLRVWSALLRVPPGSVVSYESLAAVIGAGTATRAVGRAVGSNTLAYLIPCHRVIRKTGLPGGYRWGVDRKRALLGWEASQLDQAASPASLPGRPEWPEITFPGRGRA